MRQIASKWTKFAALLKHDGVAKHLPATRRYSPGSLKEMLDSYSFIVAKPVVGTGGRGVVKIERQSGGGYSCHFNSTRRHFATLEQLAAQLRRIRRGRPYLLQQGIRLSTIHGRRIDYRVKLVKQGASWKITAVVGRLARPGLFVTNVCRGGALLQGRDALRKTFPALVKSKKDTLTGVARTCTFVLERKYPGLRTLGYDFGIDQQGNIWLLEVNTNPH